MNLNFFSLKKIVLFSLFFFLSLSAQKIEIKINDSYITDFDPESISITQTDNILLIISSEKTPIANLNLNVFLNGNEIEFEDKTDNSAEIDLGHLSKGNHICKIVFNRSGTAEQMVYKFNVTDQEPIAEEVLPPKSEEKTDSEILSSTGIILLMICLVQLILIIFLYRGKGKVKEETTNEAEEFNKQIVELKSAFDSCKKNTKRLNEKNEKLLNEINSLEKNIKELEEINSILVDQKEMLQAKKTQLEELQNQKDDLFAMVVHDIKNPASVIQSLIQLMESYDLTATEQQEIMQTLVESTQNIIKLSKEMSDVIARQKDPNQLNLEAASIKTIIDSVCSLNSPYAKKKNIKLINHSSDSLPEIIIDAGKIKEVIDNLVNNAVKYGPEKTVVEVKAYFSETKITVEVSDTGAGLSEHDLKIMFSKGMTLSTKPTGGEHSSGLGLWISKKIIEEHGGKIWAKSKQGVGTKFYFELPIK